MKKVEKNVKKNVKSENYTYFSPKLEIWNHMKKKSRQSEHFWYFEFWTTLEDFLRGSVNLLKLEGIVGTKDFSKSKAFFSDYSKSPWTLTNLTLDSAKFPILAPNRASSYFEHQLRQEFLSYRFEILHASRKTLQDYGSKISKP